MSASKLATPRTRKIITPSRTTVRFLRPSAKSSVSIPCESTLENDFALLAEFSRGVKSIATQIEKHIEANGLAFTTHIDFELVLTTGEIRYYEIKYEENSKEPDVAERLAATRAHLAEEGFQFFVDTEINIRKNVRTIQNLEVLRRFKHRSVDVKALAKKIPRSLSTVEQLVHDVGDNNTAIAMIAWQLVHCDYSLPLNNQTHLRAMEDNDHAFLYI
jgi:hypothetical protein